MARVTENRSDFHSALVEAKAQLNASLLRRAYRSSFAIAHVQLRESTAPSRFEEGAASNSKGLDLLMALGGLYPLEKKFDASEATFLQAVVADKKNAQPRVRLLNQYVVCITGIKQNRLPSRRSQHPNDPLYYRMTATSIVDRRSE